MQLFPNASISREQLKKSICGLNQSMFHENRAQFPSIWSRTVKNILSQAVWNAFYILLTNENITCIQGNILTSTSYKLFSKYETACHNFDLVLISTQQSEMSIRSPTTLSQTYPPTSICST